MPRVEPVIASPASCSREDLDLFCRLVRHQDEVVTQGLEARVRGAKALVFLKVDGEVVGIAALKQPATNYRNGVFKKAGVPAAAVTYAFELGWVYVLPSHQGKKYSRVVSAAALSQSNCQPTFASTRLDNIPMQKTLEHLGFRRLGDSWRSERGKHPTLVLYVA